MRTTARIISALLALALVGAGVIAVVEIVLARVGRKPLVLHYPQWDHYARTNTWTSPSLRWILIGLCVAGVVLIALALAHRRPVRLKADSGGTGLEVTVQRSSLESALAEEAGRLDGIGKARVRVDRGVATVKASATRRDTTGMDSDLNDRLRERLAAWGLGNSVKVKCRIERRAA